MINDGDARTENGPEVGALSSAQPQIRAEITSPADATAAPVGSATPDTPGRVWRPSRRTLLLTGLGVAVAAVAVPVGIKLASGDDPVTLPTDPNKYLDSAVFSPDGTILATVASGVVSVWNVATRTNIATLTPPNPTNVAAVAFSPDSRTLAIANSVSINAANSLGRYGGVLLWDVATQKATAIRTHANPTNVAAVAFSPDGKTLAIANSDMGFYAPWERDGTVEFWDLAAQKTTTILTDPDHHSGNHVHSVAFSPDGKTLAVAHASSVSQTQPNQQTAYSGTVTLWDLPTQRISATLSPSSNTKTSVLFVAFSPNSTILAAVAGGMVSMWDLATQKIITTLSPPKNKFGESKSASAVAFRPDGTTLAMATAGSVSSDSDDVSGGTVLLWNLDSHQYMRTLDTHTAQVRSLAFSPDGTILASGGSKLMLWSVD